MARALMTRAERLAAYLAVAARTPCVWGQFDCVVGFAAGWVARERGIDPAAAWRGTYTSPLGAARLMRAHGGLPAMVARECARIDLAATPEPQLGDVGIVWLQGARRRVQAMALRSFGRWAFLSPNGVGLGRAVLIQAWRV